MRLALLHASRGNVFMRDILEAIAFEARELGVEASVVDDDGLVGDDVVHVVIPHEYFALVPQTSWPSREMLGRTIALCVEHPGTHHFEVSTMQAGRCGAVVDINNDSTAELRARGVDVTHFQLGYTRAWDRWLGADRPRTTDITYLGSLDPRRTTALAAASEIWWDVRVHLGLTDGSPALAGGAGILHGAAKYDLLADSRIVLNMHRARSRAFEWVRVLEAICNGAVVVSEHSVDAWPLHPGEHFLSSDIASLGTISRGLLDQPDRLRQLQGAAYEKIRTELPLRRSVERLLAVADSLAAAPSWVPAPAELPVPEAYVPPPPGWPQHTSQLDLIAAGVRRLEGRLRQSERALTRAALGLGPDEPPPLQIHETPAFATAAPQVSVIVPLHNHAVEVLEALRSIEASVGVDYEVLVQDDASGDGSFGAVVEHLRERPWFPCQIARTPVNQGLSATRNALWRRARGDYVFALDADNGVYPPALARLAAALDAQPDAAFAYSIICGVKFGKSELLISQFPWDSRRLRWGNYIDAMAMLRRSTLERFGGWSTAMPFGWEDFHLWARIGEAALPAAFVPQALCWYRVTEHSMLATTNLDLITMWSQIRADAPTLMAAEPVRTGVGSARLH